MCVKTMNLWGDRPGHCQKRAEQLPRQGAETKTKGADEETPSPLLAPRSFSKLGGNNSGLQLAREKAVKASALGTLFDFLFMLEFTTAFFSKSRHINPLKLSQKLP